MGNVLTVAGFDPTGGAGVTADLKTIAAHGHYGISIVTAITVQNTLVVKNFISVDSEIIHAQLDTLLEDIEVSAIKIGMIGSEGIAEILSRWFSQNFVSKHLVLDPVIIASSGYSLCDSKVIDIMRTKLFQLATVVTPNLTEASLLIGGDVKTLIEMEFAAKLLHSMGSKYVLVKGGHLEKTATDLLYDGSSFHYFTDEKIDINIHGTGCALSSSLASFLANGMSVVESIKQAKIFISKAIKNSISIGKGMQLLNFSKSV